MQHSLSGTLQRAPRPRSNNPARSNAQAAALQAAKSKVLVAKAALLALPTSAAEHLLTTHKPGLQQAATAVLVGRAHLPRDARTRSLQSIAAAATAAAKPRAFAHTGHAARLLESVATGVAAAEPLLLVGEAGTGKTALVQHLAEQVGLF